MSQYASRFNQSRLLLYFYTEISKITRIRTKSKSKHMETIKDLQDSMNNDEKRRAAGLTH